jgi:regulator of protease activity HflC (stomatin/prohibitin superfamily)
MQDILQIGIVVAVAITAIIFAVNTINIVSPYEKAVIVRLGKFKEEREQGIVLVLPFIEKLTRVDMRERLIDVPEQDVITKDNAIVTVDAVVFFKIITAKDVLFHVQNFKQSTTNLAQTTLRNLIGDIELDQVLSSRDAMNEKLRSTLDIATDPWGVKITKVELKEIKPRIAAAMDKQAEAERLKRAVMTTAEGEKEAAIRKAEGEKEAILLKANAEATAIKVTAAAKAEAIEVTSKAEASRFTKILGSIKAGAPNKPTLDVLYIENAIGKIADGNATKIYVPHDLLNPVVFGDLLGLSKEGVTQKTTEEKLKKKSQEKGG